MCDVTYFQNFQKTSKKSIKFTPFYGSGNIKENLQKSSEVAPLTLDGHSAGDYTCDQTEFSKTRQELSKNLLKIKGNSSSFGFAI